MESVNQFAKIRKCSSESSVDKHSKI